MKPRYKLGFLVQTESGKHGIISSVILEEKSVSYRFDGEPNEFPENEITACFREVKPRTTAKTSTKKGVSRTPRAAKAQTESHAQAS